jgi:hypothetical protein
VAHAATISPRHQTLASVKGTIFSVEGRLDSGLQCAEAGHRRAEPIASEVESGAALQKSRLPLGGSEGARGMSW